MKVKRHQWVAFCFALGFIAISAVALVFDEQPTSEKTQTSEPPTVSAVPKPTSPPIEKKTVEIQIVEKQRMPLVTLAPGVILKNIRCYGNYFDFTLVNRRQTAVGYLYFPRENIFANEVNIKYFDRDGDPVPGDYKFGVTIGAETAQDKSHYLETNCFRISKARITHTVR